MLNVFFQGRVRQQVRLEEFACDVISDLLPREFKREVNIHVRFVKSLDALGYCHKEDNETICIEICNQGPIEQIASTLAHELVHAKQFIRGEVNAFMTRWKGLEIPVGPRGGIEIPYRQQPWEREAFKKEVELVKAFW